MLRQLRRTAQLAASFALVGGFVPAVASAQFTASACTAPGVCTWGQASLSGTTLTMRLQNLDATFGTSLYSAKVGLGSAMSTNGQVLAGVTRTSGTNLYGAATTIGAAADWYFDSFIDANTVELSGFSWWIEGTAPTTYRSTDGAYETTGSAGASYFEFSADIGSFGNIAGNSITSLEFLTDNSSPNPAVVATPEPASLALLATGLFGIGAVGARRRRINS